MDIKRTFLGIWNIPVFIFCDLVVIVKNMYNLCNAGDQVSDFRALIFRMTCCRWEFEFNPLEQRKSVLYSEFWPWMLSLLPVKKEMWSMIWEMGFGFLLCGLYLWRDRASSVPVLWSELGSLSTWHRGGGWCESVLEVLSHPLMPS